MTTPSTASMTLNVWIATRSDDPMPLSHSGLYAISTGRDRSSRLMSSAWAPITTRIGRHIDARAVSTARRRRVCLRKGNSCLGWPILCEPPAARMTAATDFEVIAPITWDGSSRLGQFGAEHVDSFDDGRRGEQGGRLRDQCLRNRSIEMGLPPRFVGERVEDTERGRTDAQGEPDGGRGLLSREFKPLHEKRGEVRLSSRFG